MLYGYRFSVYTRIARMVLAVRDLEYRFCEINPFETPADPVLARVSPFHRVPVLDHDGFRLFETSAIARYVATRFPGPDLIPHEARAAARMEQVIAIVDAHGYLPMVRQVFSHAVFRPLIQAPVDSDLIETGLAASVPVLSALEDIAVEALVLRPDIVTLADLHLAAMVGYFVMAPQGRAVFSDCPALMAWWSRISEHPAYVATAPALATLAVHG